MQKVRKRGAVNVRDVPCQAMLGKPSHPVPSDHLSFFSWFSGWVSSLHHFSHSKLSSLRRSVCTAWRLNATSRGRRFHGSESGGETNGWEFLEGTHEKEHVCFSTPKMGSSKENIFDIRFVRGS